MKLKELDRLLSLIFPGDILTGRREYILYEGGIAGNFLNLCWDSENLLCFSNQEAIETFKEALKLKSDFIDAYKSLGQAYRYSKSMFSCFYFPTACYLSITLALATRQITFHFVSLVFLLPLSRELGDFESAIESFQKALMLDQNHIQSLQLRGMMLYHHGSLQEAIGNFKVPM